MTTSYYADRVNLYHLHHQHPQWSQQQLADALGRSLSWVKKWLHRLSQAQATGQSLDLVLQGQSRARKHPPAATDPLIVEQVLTIRDSPPEGLRRTPGPKAILYYLDRITDSRTSQLPHPRSSSTIYRILKQHGRILPRQPRRHRPVERPAPLSHWQLDFKDVSSVPAQAEGKQQHSVETLNVLDMGTSILLQAHVRSDFTAETALSAVAHSLQSQGVPEQITLDRDPRWVGRAQGSDFPSALLRFCSCLGIEVQVCDPHHPQQNAFVERYHRTYQEECLTLDRPTSLGQAREVTARFVEHYNYQRPNQALSCGNRPPRTAFATLPRLPALPQQVDPDGWLLPWHGWHVERKVNAHGMVSLDLKAYYVGVQLAGQRVSLQLDAISGSIHVFHQQQRLRSLPLKGLVGHLLSFEQFLAHMLRQARAQQRLRSLQERRARTAALASP